MALIGTPLGSSQSLAMQGHCLAGAVTRALGWANSSPLGDLSLGRASRVLPFQSTNLPFAGYPIPSHQTSPSSVRAQFVKIVFFSAEMSAFLFDSADVPGATPKKPASGLMAYKRPSSPNFIQAMSSPTVSTFQPGIVGISMAKFVFPQADGKAPVTYLTFPSGFVSLRMSMCSASQPSLRARTVAMRRAKHFFPRRAFPPYPEP